MESDRKGEDAPGDVVLAGFGSVQEPSASAVDVCLASKGDGLENIAPVTHKGGHLVEDAAAREPIS